QHKALSSWRPRKREAVRAIRCHTEERFIGWFLPADDERQTRGRGCSQCHQFSVAEFTWANLHAIDVPGPALIRIAIGEENRELLERSAPVEAIGIPVVLLLAIHELCDD